MFCKVKKVHIRMEKNNSKISGYLEKKGKMKMISCYKKYWFVLEGGLLLYYRSKADYETISPCKGSINLGPPCNIKPCASTTGVFQIQTRTAAVTLRAENREEQNRWMQALMSEINPNKNQQRMSHFRYSMDDLQQKEPTETKKQTPPTNNHQRQNIPPKNEDPNSQITTDVIIQRLQKMGAQSCIPQGTPKKLPTARKTPREISQSIENLSRVLENTEYADLMQNSDYDVHSQTCNQSSDHIYERIKAELIDNTIYSVPDKSCRQKTKKYMTLPDKAYSSLRIRSLSDAKRPITFILENDTYSVSIHQKINEDHEEEIENKQQVTDALWVENDQYAYTNPRTDQNENEVIASDSSEENGYSEISELFQKPAENSEHALTLNTTIEHHEQKKKPSKSKTKEKRKDDGEKSGSKLVKRPSFLRRVWKRKGKHKTKENEADDVIYESVPSAVVEKLAAVNDGTAVQMLTELQNILESKMPIIIRQITSDVGSTINSPKSETSSDYKSESIIENDLYCDINDLQLQEIDSPPVPPKSRQIDTPYPFHDIPPNVRPIDLPAKKTTSPSDNLKSIDDILQDLEEEQPHNNNNNNNNNVKRLIKRFSDHEDPENEVVLRGGRQCQSHVYRDDIEQDELSRLLEELAKVASAPILKPGVTTSLDVSNLDDLELKKLLPGRRRRFSEPDYDVPRPHKSLTILPRTEANSEAIIGSTRFFGPILKPSDMVAISGESSDDPSTLNSITPDSLEASPVPKPKTDRDQRRETETEPTYYKSHHYYKFTDPKQYNNSRTSENCAKILQEPRRTSFIVENDIYDEVQCFHKVHKTDGHKRMEIPSEGNGCESEEFVDSLEVCKNEVSTGF
ncbi:unnamed protein product [Phaedon cochleariae]|uniref:PH domain-containing protein n=1 Tax=Phaedon cochleariae TaxID=80249 RepID=A0A9P0DCP6_PHACE|nr:unnamed protein product [Phaedon cochleariae]